MLKCFQDFLIYIFVCLTEVLSSLRMSENYIFNTCIYKHIRGDLTCVSSALLKIHVLSSNLDVCSLSSLYNWYNINSRYAEYDIYVFVSYEWF